MKAVSLNLTDFLTATCFDPSPHRFREGDTPVSERNLPVEYKCENCGYHISFKTSDFEKHTNSTHTNIQAIDRKIVEKTTKKLKLRKKSFLDFYCPKCEQATTLLFEGGPSGYWGTFEFTICHIFVLKSQEEKETIVSKLTKLLCAKRMKKDE